MSDSEDTVTCEVFSTRALRGLWKDPFSRKDDLFDIRRSAGQHLIAVSQENHPTLIVEINGFSAQVGRLVGRVRLRFFENVRLEIEGTTSHADVAAFECLDSAMSDTFAVLVADLLEEIGLEASSPPEVLKAFARWHDLLASRERLSRDAAQGLWGELAVLDLTPDIGGAEAAWNGPTSGVIDFLRGTVGLEVKTARRRRRHTVSYDQALFGELDYEAFLLSLWVQDNEAGTTLPELVESIAAQVYDEARFRKKIRGLGFREEDAEQYETRLMLVEDPVAFPMRVVPRIEYVPDGASNVRWDIDLSSKAIADEAELKQLLAKISGVQQ